MDVAWGDAAVDRTAGVDIAGIRGLDKQMEALFVNGITTVTLRGRYLTILTWAIGEFFSAEADAGETSYSPDRFSTFLRRIEFLVLACSTVEGGGGAPGGAIGTQTFQPQMAALVAGGTVPFPEHGGGTMLGTYFGLCRALGLLAYAGQGLPVPFALTPRGRATWDVRRRALADVGWRAVVSSDGVGSDEARALAPHFSLRSLDPATGEAEALRDALLQPWRPDDATADQVEASAADLRAAAASNVVDPSTLVWVNGHLAFPATQAFRRAKSKVHVRFLGEVQLKPYFVEFIVPVRDVLEAGILAMPALAIREVAALIAAAV